ncbi:MurR/RpiR family transcriptional regulator [Thomasclavelia sp.]|uniref:MurR/RpiR family transcriptional regulator n=1 Tax=Thomasclavelia sp. TaxID=3025757 RepID=UPI0025F29C80|nr:MurR/RpiR family transcriptional regulator [Thomasclavelia sp.]
MGDILLSRIIKYLNGTLFYDGYYQFCTFVIANYKKMIEYNFDQVCAESKIDPRTIIGFLNYLGFENYDQFHEKLVADDILRNDQIRARMLSISYRDLFKLIEVNDYDEFMDNIVSICHDIYEAKRIVIIGGLFPSSIAVEFQTDLITLGKNVIQYHAYDPDNDFKENDFVVFFTSTGRSLRDFIQNKSLGQLQRCDTMLITQNRLLENENLKEIKYFFSLPGRFDGISFNYQLMAIMDMIRIIYYQEYFV